MQTGRPPLRRLSAALTVAGATASWGLVPLFIRRAEAYGTIHPSVEALVVMASIALGAMPLLLREGDAWIQDLRRSPRACIPLLCLGIAEALNVFFLFAAYQRTSIAIATAAHGLSPLFVALAAPFALGERLTSRTIVACIGGSFGLAVLLRVRAAHHEGELVGIVFAVASALFFASSILVMKRLTTRLPAGALMVVRALFALPLFALLTPVGALHVTPSSAAWLVAAGLGPGVVGGAVFLAGLRRVTAGQAAVSTMLEPLVAIATAKLALGEPLTAHVMLGASVVLASACIVLLGQANVADSRTKESS